MKSLSQKTRAYTLKNALAHNGKAAPGPVIAALFNEGLKKEDMKIYGKQINEIIKEINSLSIDQQKKEFESLEKQVSKRVIREGLPELPNVPKNGVVMRFSPSPSGPMHIGHVRTFLLSYLYVKKYKGKLYLRIEDTNPENIYKPAYKMLEQEARWLTKGLAKVIVQSDRMNLYYKYAKKLIKKKSAYVCTCSGDKFREYVKNKKNCPCRNLTPKDNLERWNKMLSKKGYKEGEAVLRFKSDMKHKNPAMRDFPLARVNTKSHPKTKDKYRVWPLMNLAVSVDDIEAGMTHIIRGKDHRDNAERQKMIYKILGKKYPWAFFIGRYKFTDLILSATKTRQAIEAGKYSGWDDPKLATIAALKKRYKPEIFWRFTEKAGLIESDRTLDRKEFFRMLDNIFKELDKK
ncbi:MAG: glutamate--tRNA ligase family protein [archaeon]